MNRNNQKGIGGLALLVLLFLGGVVFSVGMKLFSPYTTHETVKSVVQSVSEDPTELAKPNAEIRRDIERRFTINQVKLPNRDSLQIIQNESELTFLLDYEVRVPMFFNIDAVVMFKEEFKATKP